MPNLFNVSDDLVNTVKKTMEKGTLVSNTEKMNQVVLNESDWRHIQGVGTQLAGFSGTLAAHVATGVGPNIATVVPAYFATQHLANKAYKNGIRKDLINAYKKEFQHINKYGEDHPKTKKVSDHVGDLENEYFDRYGNDDFFKNSNKHVNTKENMAKKDKYGNLKESAWRHVMGGGMASDPIFPRLAKGYQKGLQRDIINASNKAKHHEKKYGEDHPKTLKAVDHIENLENEYFNRHGADSWWKSYTG